jgi:hypothetical protein
MSRVAATNVAFNEARAFFKPIATGPCPTDPYERMCWDMAGMYVHFPSTVDSGPLFIQTFSFTLPSRLNRKPSHYVITETLANIYVKADSIPPAEQEKFAHFSLLGIQLLIHHHWVEETIICMFFKLEAHCCHDLPAS